MHNLTFIYLTGALLAFYSVLFLTFKSLYKKRLAGEGVKILKALGFYFLALILPLIIGYFYLPAFFIFSIIFFFLAVKEIWTALEKPVWKSWKFWGLFIILFFISFNFIARISFRVGDRSVRNGYCVQWDSQVRSDLSLAASDIESYYYNNNASYSGYESNSESGWNELKNNIPPKSRELLEKESSEAVIDNKTDEYQINISDDGESYVAWAPLCRVTHDKLMEETSHISLDSYLRRGAKDLDKYIVFHCVDSNSNREAYRGNPVNLEAENCDDLFGR